LINLKKALNLLKNREEDGILVKLDFEAIENNELVFIVVPSDLIQQANLQILKYLDNTKKPIFVYTTFTKPYTAITKILEKNDIKTDKMFFIDCVTPVAGSMEMHGTSKCLFYHNFANSINHK